MHELGGRRVLVTGAGGFIGASLVRTLLAAGAAPIAVMRPGSDRWRLRDAESELELETADLADPAAVEVVVQRARPELAVNLAFPAGHPETAAARHEQVAVALGTAALVESLAEAGCRRLVHVGSSLEYGSKTGPIHEDDVLEPVAPRGAAKAAASLVCLAWARALGLSACVLRPFSVYGPWEHDSRLVPTALRAALEGSLLPITEPGVVRDFVFVEDLGDAIVRALTSSGVDGTVINVGSGTQTSIEDLVAAVGRVVGREVSTAPGAYPRRSHDASSWIADIERARRVLGWEPSVLLEDGLRRTLAWLEGRSALVR